ncbi:MAG: glycosyltransferase [Anaerolineales bacterium]|nr:glycosyltransferase [Anaerolineales bacterium]
MKLALVASWLNQYGGAERVLEVMHAVFPDAPIFTSTYHPATLPAAYRAWDIRASFLDRLPLKSQRALLPLYPAAFESLDLRGYDTILSNTSAFAHGIRVPPGARHICYCLTPARFLWNYADYVKRENIGRLPRAILPLFIARLRAWDRRAADRVTQFVAISETVRERIATYYQRDATIIHPPVDVERFAVSSSRDDYFLVLSRLVPYKRIDLAVQAFNELGLPLIIAGDGRDRARLQTLAKPNVQFLGRVSDEQARDLLARCRAFLFPGEEDFGITPLEANASGKPVIAFAGGGARETIIAGVTGEFFREPTAQSLAQVIRVFDDARYDPLTMRRHAEKFSVAVFKEKLTALVSSSKFEVQG